MEIVYCLPYFGFFLLVLLALAILGQTVGGAFGDLGQLFERYANTPDRDARRFIRKVVAMAFRLKYLYWTGLGIIALAVLAFLGALCTGQEQFADFFLAIAKRLR